jgi:uncharacterized protein (DUF924 family)
MGKMETANTIREFWFGTCTDDVSVVKEKFALWWRKEAAIDGEIRRRFAEASASAARGALDDWLSLPAGRLALILLTDQFPRNMYRDTPRAFAFDPLALAWCKEGLRESMDEALRPIERVFFYLPLEHSESLEDQDASVCLFEALLETMNEDARPAFQGFLDFAYRHRDIIARFGRFPHRNRILGRESSPEEKAFLQEKGSSF